LGTLGGDLSFATAIDDNNVIVGNANTPPKLGQLYNQTGFVFLNGSMHNISVWSTDTIVDANGVSDAGIAGDEDGDPLGGFGSTGFIMNGSLISIGTSEDVSSENGINQAGLAVGYKVDAPLGIFGPQYASIFANGVTYDLNTLVDLSSSDFTRLTEAKAISNTGYIAGLGTTTSGATHAFLLTPIPTP
jgi:probable HAF family extracellular repeat protein